MPAKSKDQATAAKIALAAKRNGTIDKLPKNSASHNMATSMSEKELEKFTHVKESASWGRKSLLEVFAEEMLDTDGPGEEIASSKSTNDALKDKNNKINNDTDIDSVDATWDDKVYSQAPMTSNPGAFNSLGGRVAEQAFGDPFEDVEDLDTTDSDDEEIELTDADSFGDEREDFGADFGDGSSPYDGENPNFEDEMGDFADAKAEMESEQKEKMIGDMVSHILFHNKNHGTPASQWDPEDLIMDFEYNYPINSDNEEDVEVAREAINLAMKQTGEEVPATATDSNPEDIFGVGVEESVENDGELIAESFTPARWKQLANLK